MREFDKQMEMVLYHSNEGDVSVDAYIMDESLWITQKAMAELFGVQVPAISKHLKKIFEEGELDEKVHMGPYLEKHSQGRLCFIILMLLSLSAIG